MSQAPISLDALNAMDAAGFAAALGTLYEHSPWVPALAATRRPFATVSELHEALAGAMTAAPAEDRLALLRAHPELGSKVARAELTDASRAEQGSLGLDRLSDGELQRFQALNRAYTERFGFPFIVCVRRHTRDSILAHFERRLANSPESEMAAALDEVALIARLRLVAAVDGPGKPRTDGRLSTHVLDTARGRPAPGVRVVLTEIGASARGLLADTATNADGRTDVPLLAGAPLRIGTYELAFHAGDYFRANAIATAEPPFLDIVPLRFSIAEPEGHYHVPLLLSPWSFSTYRGS